MVISIQCGMLDDTFGTFTIENGVVTMSGNVQALTTLLDNYRHKGDTEGQSDTSIVEQLPTIMRNWYWAKNLSQQGGVKYNQNHDEHGRFSDGSEMPSPQEYGGHIHGIDAPRPAVVVNMPPLLPGDAQPKLPKMTDDDFTIIKNEVEKSQKYNPYHDAQGRFDTGPTSGTPIALASPAPGTLTGPDAVTLTNYMAKNGVTRAVSLADGTALMEQSRLAGTLAVNADWYNRAADASNALAVKYGLTPDQTSGVIAAMSPRSAWDAVSKDGMVTKPNLRDALTIMKMYSTNPDVTITPAVVDALAKYDSKTGFSALVNTTQPFQDFTPQQQSFLISGSVRGYPANSEKAFKILGGETPDDTLGGPKVRSFYNNIRYPDQSGSVTVDTWMAKLLSGANTSVDTSLKVLNGIRGGNFKKIGAYPYYSDIISEIATSYNMRPHEAQAVMWVQGRINAGGKTHEPA